MTLRPLHVLGSGAMTGVGLDAPSTYAALRARIDAFNETRFIAPNGTWVFGSEVPLPEPWRGVRRQAHLLAGALGECLALVNGNSSENIPLLCCTAELNRPGRLEGLGNQLFHEACDLLKVEFHEESRVLDDGKVAAAVALHHAEQLIHDGGFRFVIVAGVDSFLIAETLRFFGDAERLMTEGAMDGFFPGEAGAAIVLSAAGGDLVIQSLGFGVEKATIDSGEPLRGDGLTKAYRDALDQADLAMADIGYRISGLSGEQYGFKQTGLASLRLLRGKHDFQDLWHPADCVGDTGAASFPLMLGWAGHAARNRYAPGSPILFEASNEDGRCVAVIARHAETYDGQ